MNVHDVETWRITAIILGIVSIAMFLVQRSSYMFLDVIFEFCIFHVPAMIAVGVYAYLRMKKPTLIVEGVSS